MCTLKPLSKECNAQVQKGATTKGCHGCPVSNGAKSSCVSTHKNATAKKRNSSTSMAIASRISAKAETKRELALV